MTNTLIETGTFAIDEDARTLRGILLPWGEKSRPSVSNTQPIYFARGSVTLPRDPAVVTLNRSHDRFDPVGRATVLEDRPEGIYAEFKLANTEEADDYLSNPSKLRKLSAEVTGIVRDAADTARGIKARLTGGALVSEGAFASAALFSVGEEVTEAAEDPEAEQSETTAEVIETPDETVVVVTIPEADPESEDEESEGDAVADAKAPETLTASAKDMPQDDVNALFKAITQNAKFGDPSALQAIAQRDGGLFALNDVKISGANQVGTAVVQPQFVGELWSGRTFARKTIPLLGHGDLQSITVTGYRWTTKPEVDTWAGNKAAVPTNTPATEAYSVAVARFAGGHDVAREFLDFGVTEVLDSYTRHMVDSYARKSDAYALAQIVSGATTAAVGTLPSGVGSAIGKIVRGALRVINADALPSFAIVATDVFEELAFTKKDDVLAYLDLALGLEEGTLESFRIVPNAGMAAGTVLVGAKEAATVLELPDSPIRVNALDLVKGGYDEALFGYIAVKVDYPTGLQLVTPNP